MHAFTSMSQPAHDSLSVWSGQGVGTDSIFDDPVQMCQMLRRVPPPPREPPTINLESMLRSSRAQSELAPTFSPTAQKPSDLIPTRLSTAAYPSAGSAAHQAGNCKPCAFFHTKGCENGCECEFCHLCEAGEKKKRQKDKLANRKSLRSAREAARHGGC